MARKTKDIMGSLGKIDGSFSIGIVRLTFSSDKLGETLSLSFKGECQMTLQYQEICDVADKVKSQMISGVDKKEDGYWEKEALTTGIFVSGKGSPIPRKGEIHINLRSDGEHEMLSIAFEDRGEISISYFPVKELVADTRNK